MSLGRQFYTAVFFSTVFGFSAQVCAQDFSNNFKDKGEALTLFEAIKTGTTELNFRFRTEHVRVLGSPVGQANTLRSMMTFDPQRYKDFAGVLEFSNTASYWDSRQNPGLYANDHVDRPVINDPRGAALTRAALEYICFDDTRVILGRQFIRLDNQRLVGSEDFRQMPQTFDAIALINNSFSDVEMYYAWAVKFNTVEHPANSNGQRDVSSHFFNVSWKALPAGDLIFYAYLNDDKDLATASSDTYGIKFTGDTEVPNASILYGIEHAMQRGRHENPVKYSARYYLLELGVRAENIVFKSAYEIIEGDAAVLGRVFQMPFGSKHGFNGNADVFSAFPNRGLRDLSFVLNLDMFGVKTELGYHQFRVQTGPSQRYGQEYDISIYKEIIENVKVGLEFANFNAANGSEYNDTRKLWLSFVAKF